MTGDIRVVFSTRLGALGETEQPLVDHPNIDLVEATILDEDAIRTELAGAQIVIAGAVEPFTAEVLADLDDLAVIVRRGVGVNNVDTDAATRLGITVAFVPDATVEEVSDQALALLLAAERRVALMDRAVRAGDGVAARGAVDAARRFNELTLGVVGLGRIGRRLAEKARGIFGSVVGFDVVDVDIDGVAQVGLDEVFATADAISVHLPLLDATRGMLNADVFAHCGPGTVFVNTSRGEVVDEAALVAALNDGRIAAAGLDVTETDPPPAGHPLYDLETVILTGHTASRGAEGSRELRRRTIAAAIDAVEGRRPTNVVDADAWDVRGAALAARAGEA